MPDRLVARRGELPVGAWSHGRIGSRCRRRAPRGGCAPAFATANSTGSQSMRSARRGPRVARVQAAARRADLARGRGAAPGGAGRKQQGDRGQAGDQREDRAQPRRAHLREDRRLEPHRREHVRPRARTGRPASKIEAIASCRRGRRPPDHWSHEPLLCNHVRRDQLRAVSRRVRLRDRLCRRPDVPRSVDQRDRGTRRPGGGRRRACC